jgi:hypothetical protein
MRKLILTIVAVVVLGAPVGQAVRADDTTVIKREEFKAPLPKLESWKGPVTEG